MRSASASPSPFVGPAVWIAVLGCLGWFFVVMAQIEPLTGDGWYNADEAKEGVTAELIVKQLTYLHSNGNPRIGLLFTILAYGSRTFHLIATPFFSLALVWLIAAHALGRWPSLRSPNDALLTLLGAAACFLAVPQPGHAFFYRPITTNYIYTLSLSLAFFVPQRFDLRVRSMWAAAAWSVLALAVGLFIGKTNEHTGPTMVVVAALYTAYKLRAGQRLDVAWHASATLGLLVGYCYLFFAPGQAVRYGALGRQSVAETVLGRGLRGTADLFGEYGGYVGPMLLGMALLALLCVALAPNDGFIERVAGLKWTVISYVAVSCLVLGTSLAAPKNLYRLFIAPAVLLVIAAVAAMRAAQGRAPSIAIALSSVVVCAGMIGIFVPMYTEIHEDELARNAIITSADPKRPITVPRTRHAKRDSYYYGDSITADPRHRARMAALFGVKEIRVAAKPADKDKKKKKPVKKVVKPPAPKAPAPIEGLGSVPELELIDGAAP
jgi:hypothetical protein